MRKLLSEEIEKLAARPKVKRIAVENFLCSLPLEIGWANNLKNLDTDAKIYRWTRQTHKAIKDGIAMAYRGKP